MQRGVYWERKKMRKCYCKERTIKDTGKLMPDGNTSRKSYYKIKSFKKKQTKTCFKYVTKTPKEQSTRKYGVGNRIIFIVSHMTECAVQNQ